MSSAFIDRLTAHLEHHDLVGLGDLTFQIDVDGTPYSLAPEGDKYALKQAPLADAKCHMTATSKALDVLMSTPNRAMQLWVSKKITATDPQAAMKLALALQKVA
jgi:hypothetical protein